MRTLVTATLLLCTALPALAAQDLMDIYRLARQQDPQLNSARAAAGAAGARYREARGKLFPQVSARASRSKVRQESSGIDFSRFNQGGSGGQGGANNANRDIDFQDQEQRSVNLQQALFDWSAWQAKDAAAARASQADKQLSAAQADLIVRSARSYFNVLAAQAARDAAQQQADVIGKQLDRAKAAYDSGLAPITDLQQAQSQLDSVRVDGINAGNDLANSRDALTQMTGAPTTTLVGVAAPDAVTQPSGEVDAWVHRALAHNPTLAAQRKALDAAGEDVSRAWGGHLPTVSLTGSIGRNEQPLSFAGNTQQVTETKSVGIEVNLPLFAGGSTVAAVDEAEFKKDQALQDYIKTQRQVALNTRTALRNLRAAAARVKALGKAIKSGNTAVEAAEAGMRNGTRNILDVLQAQTDLIQRRVNRKKAFYDYAVAGLKLKQAAGVLGVPDLQRVNARLRYTPAAGNHATDGN